LAKGKGKGKKGKGSTTNSDTAAATNDATAADDSATATSDSGSSETCLSANALQTGSLLTGQEANATAGQVDSET
jgi:hypothetical protein